jgi:hypothetical protein
VIAAESGNDLLEVHRQIERPLVDRQVFVARIGYEKPIVRNSDDAGGKPPCTPRMIELPEAPNDQRDHIAIASGEFSVIIARLTASRTGHTVAVSQKGV